MKLTLFLISITFLSANFAHAQNMQGFKPSGINGSAGAGFVEWETLEPLSSNVRFDQGQFVAIAGEKGFNFFNLYLNLSLAYMKTTGQTHYSYSNLSTETYTASDVNFSSELFQAGLGLKWKIIDGYWIRPYVEGGGTGGYFTIKYDNLDAKVTSTPANQRNYKKSDSLLDFGRYVEGGAEISFSQAFGLRAAARFIESRTKKLQTLGNAEIQYKANVYYLSLLMSF